MVKSLGCLLEPITTLKVANANGNELICNELQGFLVEDVGKIFYN